MPKNRMTAARRAEERDYERRMRDGAAARKAGEHLRRLCQPSAQPDKIVFQPRTARFKIAKAFAPGSGRLS